MKVWNFCIVATAWLAMAWTVVVEATPTPSATCAPTAPAKVFGLPKGLARVVTYLHPVAAPALGPTTSSPLFQMRGGELHTPETLEDVEALVSNAAMNGQLVVIDFTASWCGPCKMIAPVFHELSEQREDVVFLKVDVDENPETAAKYSVSAMPTFIFLKSGEVVDRLMGANVDRLYELIEEHM